MNDERATRLTEFGVKDQTEEGLKAVLPACVKASKSPWATATYDRKLKKNMAYGEVWVALLPPPYNMIRRSEESLLEALLSLTVDFLEIYKDGKLPVRK